LITYRTDDSGRPIRVGPIVTAETDEYASAFNLGFQDARCGRPRNATASQLGKVVRLGYSDGYDLYGYVASKDHRFGSGIDNGIGED
jgi:hypothetical protein